MNLVFVRSPKFLAAGAGAAMLIIIFLAFFSPTAAGSSTSRKKSAAKSVSTDIPPDTNSSGLTGFIWPTDASRKITSTFAEYRTTHFHGGIDISTEGHKGHKVFAAKDGYVCRIVVSPFGYGKMLYLRHPDGYVTTYAHLMTFNDTINRVTLQEQLTKGTYAIDQMIDPARLPVRQGEVIALSGNSGYGPPHLHFEIRDSAFNPVNPMLSRSLRVKDTVPPRINRLMLAPLDYSSTVDNANRPKYLSRFPRSRKEFRIPQTIRLHGRVGFAVEAVDFVNGTLSKSGIHRIDFLLDDSVAYSMTMNKVPVSQTKQIDLHYDFASVRAGRGKFQKLYVDRGNSLPFYGGRPEGSGIVNTDQFSEGIHSYKIICRDASDNSTALTGKIIINHTPSIAVARVDQDSAWISGTLLGSLDKIFVSTKKLSETGWKEYSIPRKRFIADGEDVRIPLNKKEGDILKFVAETATKAHSDPVFYFYRKPAGHREHLTITVEPYEQYVKLTLTCTGVFTVPPAARVKEGDGLRDVLLKAADIDKFSGAFVPADTYEGSREVDASGEVNGVSVAASKSFEAYPISSDHGGSFQLAEGAVTVSFDSAATFKPVLLQYADDAARGSTVYEFEPTDVLLNRGITFSVAPPPQANQGRWGLFSRTSGGWVFQTSKRDEATGKFSATLARTLGDLALFRDDTPPSIERLRVVPRNRKVYISFQFRDNLSGVDPDKIKLTIDGKLVIPEIEGERRRAWYQSDERYPAGKHEVSLSMQDRMGNESSAHRQFSIR